MAGTLLIVGITLFVVGTLMLVQDASARGRNAMMVVLPFTGIAYARHHWSDVRVGAIVRVIGGSCIVFGLAALLGQNPQWLQFRYRDNGNAVLKGTIERRMTPMIDAGVVVRLGLTSKQGKDLSGRLSGEPFSYDRAQLIGGVLSLQQGESFIAPREVRILVGIEARTITQRVDVFVSPDDPQPPEIHVSVVPDGAVLPETRIYRGGYSMELQLAPLDTNQYKGYIQLILPGPEPDYLVGDFIALSNNLIYRNGRVDLTHDHPDTLEYVAQQYVLAQFPPSLISRLEFRDTDMRLSRNAGTTTVRIYLKNGRVEDKFLELERADIGWALRPGGVNTQVIVKGGDTVVEATEDATAKAAGPATRDVTFDALQQLVGQRITLAMKNGDTRVAKVLGMRRDLLQLEREVGSGMVQFTVSEKEIASVRLASGERWVLVAAPQVVDGGATDAAAEAPPVAEPAPAAPSAPAPATTTTTTKKESTGATAGATGYAALQGKTVVVTTRDGKSRTGVLLSVTDRELKLGVRLGSGVLEYFYAPSDIASIKEASN